MRRGLVVVSSLGLLLGACGDDGGDLEAFCATAEGFTGANPADVLAGAAPGDPQATAEALRSTAEALGAWADDAPDEVDDQVDLLAETAERLATTFAETSLTSTDEYVPVDTAAVEAASADVLAFTRDRCGVDLAQLG